MHRDRRRRRGGQKSQASCGARCAVSLNWFPNWRLCKRARLDYIADRYAGKYLDGATLVIGATDDEQTNAAISRTPAP